MSKEEIFLLVVLSILVIIFILYLIREVINNNKIRKSFKYVIHVNGIRGKSTITRLIDAGLRECGYKVFSKTTGTIPTIINVDNQDVEIKRFGLANIREQLKMLKLAYKEKAEIVVLECMAVNPELQRICEEKIVKSNITIISNVRPDHIGEMGDTLEEIAEAFSNTISTNGHVICGSSDFDYIFKKEAKKRHSIFHEPYPYNGEDDLETFGENISIALRVADILGLDKKQYFEGMKKYHHDVGAYSIYNKLGITFINGFSINDPLSTEIVYERVLKSFDANQISIVLNSRNDRPTRVLQHIELLSKIPCKKIFIMGSNTNFIYKKLKEKNPTKDISILKDISSLNNEKIIFGIGNIAGKGFELINYFKEGNDEF